MIAYSASLTSRLAVKTEAWPFTDYESFYKDSPYKMIVKESSVSADHFRVMGTKTLISLLTNIHTYFSLQAWTWNHEENLQEKIFDGSISI